MKKINPRKTPGHAHGLPVLMLLCSSAMMLTAGEGMQLIAVTGTARTSIVVVFLYDVIAGQHGEFRLLQ